MQEICPGCHVQLSNDGSLIATHPYIGASASCWELYSRLLMNEPQMAQGQYGSLLVDAYAVQHHGVPSAQAIQSVATHLLVLHGVFRADLAVEQTMWVRRQIARRPAQQRHQLFEWLQPPDIGSSMTVADIALGQTPQARAQASDNFVKSIWAQWDAAHRAIIASWYTRYILR
jgi:hypothetical protein